MSESTDLARVRCDLEVERTHLRAAAMVVAYSTAVFVFGLSAANLGVLGIVLVAVASCGMLAGTGLAILHGLGAAKAEQTMRRMTQLPVARVLDR